MDILHHIDLTVTDVARARSVYATFFEHVGFTLKSAGEEWSGWAAPGKRYPCITLLKAKGPNAHRSHDRYSSGLHHLALKAKSRADVDRLHVKLVEAGVTILDAPADYPDYGLGYYAVFFADPDGLKLEYVFTPSSAELRV